LRAKYGTGVRGGATVVRGTVARFASGEISLQPGERTAATAAFGEVAGRGSGPENALWSIVAPTRPTTRRRPVRCPTVPISADPVRC
jgi:hypothetical protein